MVLVWLQTGKPAEQGVRVSRPRIGKKVEVKLPDDLREWLEAKNEDSLAAAIRTALRQQRETETDQK